MNITIESSGKESGAELGTQAAQAFMRAIASQEASKQINVYDKTKRTAARRMA